jgi:hypothetical protein
LVQESFSWMFLALEWKLWAGQVGISANEDPFGDIKRNRRGLEVSPPGIHF